MDAKELRIGNWVLLDKNNRQHIYQIDSGWDIYKADESGCRDIEPIQLTEEWLLKFGFKGTTNCDAFQKNDFVVFLKSEIRKIDKPYTNWYRNGIIIIEHVHQLQNLYFALTGSELTPNTK